MPQAEATTLPRSRPAELEPRRLSSRDLLRGDRRIVIEHGDARYTLLLTRNDKLILVK
jgi:hemin uptake protein HemP